MTSDYWNIHPCNSQYTNPEERYIHEPDIFSFAQFTRYSGMKVLEVGTGIGTDYIQFLRAGAAIYGVEPSKESYSIANSRIMKENNRGNSCAICNNKGEQLPYKDNIFDLVYSWGVIHHTEHPLKVVQEMYRVLKPGGEIKIMVYNRYSILAVYKWLRYKPWRSIKYMIASIQESPGTIAYTHDEIRQLLTKCGVVDIEIDSRVQPRDIFTGQSLMVRFFAYLLSCLLPNAGWFMKVKGVKK